MLLDLPPDFETMRTQMRKLSTETDAIKAELKEANAAIEELRNEVVKLKAQQIARGHDPD
jgi:uncharacterized coiled-coil DUF342 family protein